MDRPAGKKRGECGMCLYRQVFLSAERSTVADEFHVEAVGFNGQDRSDLGLVFVNPLALGVDLQRRPRTIRRGIPVPAERYRETRFGLEERVLDALMEADATD